MGGAARVQSVGPPEVQRVLLGDLPKGRSASQVHRKV